MIAVMTAVVNIGGSGGHVDEGNDDSQHDTRETGDTGPDEVGKTEFDAREMNGETKQHADDGSQKAEFLREGDFSSELIELFKQGAEGKFELVARRSQRHVLEIYAPNATGLAPPRAVVRNLLAGGPALRVEIGPASAPRCSIKGQLRGPTGWPANGRSCASSTWRRGGSR